MKEINLILFLFFLVNHFLSQKITSSNLPKTLKEISGIEFINDSILVAHNDGGNSANLYLLNIHGKILDSVYVCNAKNTDWEDITKDNNGNLYIADIGNNNNRRKKLRILKISISSLLKNDSVEAKIYSFQYPDQELFPPPNNEFYYDAESICYHDNYLWIFTKCRTIPFDGKSKIYRISLTQIENAEWEKIGYIIPGRKSWKIDSFTSCTVYNNHFYLLTYTRLIIVDTNDISKTIKTKRFYRYIQREALAISPSGILCVANEGHWLLGKPKLKIFRNE